MLLVTGTVENEAPTFIINDTKLYVPVITLSTQDNVKLLKKLGCGFKRTINQYKYQSKIINQSQNRYLDFFVTDPSFQRVNRIFVSSFENEDGRESYRK